MSSLGSDGFNQLYNKYLSQVEKGGNLSKEQITSLANKALADGIIQPDEKDAFFQLALKSKNNVDLSKVRTADGNPLDSDITKAFDKGLQTKNTSGNFKQGFTTAQRDIKAQEESDVMRHVAGWVKDVKKYVPQVVKDMVPIETRKAVHETLDDWRLSDNVEAEINNKADKIVNNMVNINANVNKVDYKKFAADSVLCVHDSLKSINPAFKNVPKDAVEVSQSKLKEYTGVEWDAVNVSRKTGSELKALLVPDKTFITDGGHAYVFKGINKDGNLNVYDPTVNKHTIISKDNSTVTAYVMGAGDGDKTGKAKSDGSVQSFKNADMLKKINSNDFDANGKETESWNIRKTFIMLADPAEKQTVKNFSTFIKEAKTTGDYDNLKGLLQKKGIKLDDREVRAMVTVLTAPISNHGELPAGMPKAANMLEAFEWLNKSAGGMTKNQTNYLTAVQYSNVDMNNFFSKSGNETDKSNSMFNVLKEVMCGKTGC